MPNAKRAAKPKPGATTKPPIDDVEDILKIANDQSDVLYFWRRRGDVWAFLMPRPVEQLRALGIRESTRQLFGGGEFRCRLKVANSRLAEQRMFSIEGAPIDAGAAPAAVAASAPASSSREMPSWLEKIVLPVAVTLAAGLANKLLADPKTDPLVLELLKQRNKGDGTDPIAYSQAIAAAEERGRVLGQQIGELTAERDQPRRSGGESPSGTVTAIREATGLVQSLIAARGGRRETRMRVIPPAGSVSPAPPALLPSGDASPPVPTNAAPDIVPAWMRPFMSFRGLLVQAADTVASAEPIAGLIIQNADDATWAAIIEADASGRLESDILAAVPELAAHERRRAFVAHLVEVVHAEIAEPDDDEEPGADAATPHVEEA